MALDDIISGRNPTEIEFVIESAEPPMPIGYCRVYRVDHKNRSAEITCIIGEEAFRNKGYGPATARLLVDYCFGQLNMNRVGADSYSFNPRGIRVLEKVGFRREGVQRQAVFKNGVYHDKVLFGLLKNEYLPDREAI
jgi:RimJ/RimL family protein N-acetyltransferase